MDLIIRNGTIVTASNSVQADVGIKDGQIVQLGLELGPSAKEIDATGMLLLPGGVDVHTHVDYQFFGCQSADDFESATTAAAFGGVTTIVDYAFPEPGETIEQNVSRWHKKAQNKTLIDYSIHPTILEPNEKIIGEIGDAVAEGYSSFKFFMTGFAKFNELVPQYLRAIKEVGRQGALACVHAEDEGIISHKIDELRREGKRGIHHFADSRPRLAEGLAVQRTVTMGRYVESPIYLVHISCEEAAEPIHEARARGQVVYGETRPIFLHLSRERYEEDNPERYVGWPPLREPDQREVMWAGLRRNDLQTVGTDHCGWSLCHKQAHTEVDELIAGMSNLETFLAMMHSEGVAKGKISLGRMVDVCATTPAKLFGLFPQKGTIDIGSDADIVIFDPNKAVVVDETKLHSNADYDVFDGWTVQGWPVTTLSRGEVIVSEGKLRGRPGRGRHVKRRRFTELS
jgi:dihydropyrimidinase